MLGAYVWRHTHTQAEITKALTQWDNEEWPMELNTAAVSTHIVAEL